MRRPVRRPVWEDAYTVIEPQINASSIHVWPFDPGLPIDVRFFTMRREADIRMNYHDYFEMLYIHSGEVEYQIGGRVHSLRPSSTASPGWICTVEMRPLFGA